MVLAKLNGISVPVAQLSQIGLGGKPWRNRVKLPRYFPKPPRRTSRCIESRPIPHRSRLLTRGHILHQERGPFRGRPKWEGSSSRHPLCGFCVLQSELRARWQQGRTEAGEEMDCSRQNGSPRFSFVAGLCVWWRRGIPQQMTTQPAHCRSPCRTVSPRKHVSVSSQSVIVGKCSYTYFLAEVNGFIQSSVNNVVSQTRSPLLRDATSSPTALTQQKRAARPIVTSRRSFSLTSAPKTVLGLLWIIAFSRELQGCSFSLVLVFATFFVYQ